MIAYFSTFITGLGEPVTAALKAALKPLTIDRVDDGLIAYRTTATPQAVRELRFLNNTFLLINTTTLEAGTAGRVKELARDMDLAPYARLLPRSANRTFRIVISDENQLTSINREITHKIEDRIAAQTQLTLNATKADYEFWFLLRHDGSSWFGIRLTGLAYRQATDREKGALRPELAHLLSLLSAPTASDVVLDPFAGSGSIPLERSRLPHSRVLAGDNNADIVKLLHKKAGGLRTIRVMHLDARRMPEIADKSIDAVITDPPWGSHDNQTLNFHRFYTDALAEWVRVLKPGGRIVVLTAQKDIFHTVVKARHDIERIATYDILVSGKKARIFIWKRI